MTENAKESRILNLDVAVEEFWGLGIGLSALVKASGASSGSVSRYLNGKLKYGGAYNKINHALCRILRADVIVNPNK